MGNISFEAGYVFALYDVCTEYPINSAKYRINSDSGAGVLSKGHGIFVLTGNECSEFTLDVEVEGYQPYRHFVKLDGDDIKKEIFWLVPDNAGCQTRITVTAEPENEYQIFIKARESMVRLLKDCNEGESFISLQEKSNKISDGRWILFEDMKTGMTQQRRIIKNMQREGEVVYVLDLPVDRMYEKDFTKVYKGFAVTSDKTGKLCLPLPFTIKDGSLIEIYEGGRLQKLAFEVK
jgi:hypothetical protein